MAAANAQQHHRSMLKQYLQSHSRNNGATTRQGNQLSPHPTSERSKSQTSFQSGKSVVSADRKQPSTVNKASSVTGSSHVRLPYIPSSNARRCRATIESLPNELLSMIFWRLKVGDLISASQVCRRWHKVAGDNLLWKHYYARFVGPTSKEKEDKLPVQELDSGCWKNLCLRRCKVKRDQIYLKKWKQPDSYTGLKQRPELTLGKVGVRFELSFINSEGLSRTFQHGDIFWLTMSTSVRWYDLVFPEVKDVRCIQVHACSPLMFYGPSKPAKDGIVQKSLLMEYRGNLKEVLQKQKVVGSDAQIQVFELTKGLVLAKYQADGEIAFVTSALHYHNLISRCLCGSPNRCWSPPEDEHPEDDIDPHYGLHGYTCILMIRNMRQKLVECKFLHLDTTKHELAGGFATFTPVRKSDKYSHVACMKHITFPWKTVLFKGIVQDMGILDLTLLDERGEPFWTVSSAICVEQSSQTNQFDFDPNTYKAIHYQDETGKVHLEIGKLDDGSEYLSYVAISISVTAINAAFKTAY